MDEFYIIANVNNNIKMSLNFIDTEIGKVCIINIVSGHEKLMMEAELLLTDAGGENVYEKVNEFPFKFVLPPLFNTKSMVLVDLFSDGKAVVSGKINYGDKTERSKENILPEEAENLCNYNAGYSSELLSEAEYYINKAKELYNKEFKESKKEESFLAQPTSFYDKIKDDFDLLYSIGVEDYLLVKKFKFSKWRKIEIDGETIILGKFYDGTNENRVSQVAIASPAINSRTSGGGALGENAVFYEASIYDEFGFWVLVQNAVTGQAVKI